MFYIMRLLTWRTTSVLRFTLDRMGSANRFGDCFGNPGERGGSADA
jgi:hypothetical protein